MEWVCSTVILINNLLPLSTNPNAFIWGENSKQTHMKIDQKWAKTICSSQQSVTVTQGRRGRRQAGTQVFLLQPLAIQGLIWSSFWSLGLLFTFIMIEYITQWSCYALQSVCRNLHRELNTAQEEIQYTKVWTCTTFLWTQVYLGSHLWVLMSVWEV